MLYTHPNTPTHIPSHPCTHAPPIYLSTHPNSHTLRSSTYTHDCTRTHTAHTHTHTRTHTLPHTLQCLTPTHGHSHTHIHTHIRPHTHLEKLCPTIQKCEQTTCRAIQAEACSHATAPALYTHVDTHIFTNTYVFIHLQKRVLLRLYQPYLQI